MERLTRLGFRSCYLVTLASGRAAARLAADFHQVGAASARLGPFVILLQLPIVLCWLVARPISLVAFAACRALAGREASVASARS